MPDNLGATEKIANSFSLSFFVYRAGGTSAADGATAKPVFVKFTIDCPTSFGELHAIHNIYPTIPNSFLEVPPALLHSTQARRRT